LVVDAAATRLPLDAADMVFRVRAITLDNIASRAFAAILRHNSAYCCCRDADYAAALLFTPCYYFLQPLMPALDY